MAKNFGHAVIPQLVASKDESIAQGIQLSNLGNMIRLADVVMFFGKPDGMPSLHPAVLCPKPWPVNHQHRLSKAFDGLFQCIIGGNAAIIAAKPHSQNPHIVMLLLHRSSTFFLLAYLFLFQDCF